MRLRSHHRRRHPLPRAPRIAPAQPRRERPRVRLRALQALAQRPLVPRRPPLARFARPRARARQRRRLRHRHRRASRARAIARVRRRLARSFVRSDVRPFVRSFVRARARRVVLAIRVAPIRVARDSRRRDPRSIARVDPPSRRRDATRRDSIRFDSFVRARIPRIYGTRARRVRPRNNALTVRAYDRARSRAIASIMAVDDANVRANARIRRRAKSIWRRSRASAARARSATRARQTTARRGGDGRDVAVHGELRATGERDQARGASTARARRASARRARARRRRRGFGFEIRARRAARWRAGDGAIRDFGGTRRGDASRRDGGGASRDARGTRDGTEDARRDGDAGFGTTRDARDARDRWTREIASEGRRRGNARD